MKTALIFLSVFVTFTSLTKAEASNRNWPDVTKMTCREATGLVADARAIRLRTGHFTYGIFVVGPAFCDARDIPSAYVKTLDNPRCQIGYACTGMVLGLSGTSIIGTSIGGCQEGEHAFNKKDDFSITPEEFICREGKWEDQGI